MHKVSLNGNWSFALDVDGTGKKEGFHLAKKEFDDEIKVPGSWSIEKSYRDYHGCAWYKRSFMLDNFEEGQRIKIYFGGVFRYADIYINGKFVKHHAGFQSGFRVDISDYTTPGENYIAVMANDVKDTDFDIMGGVMDMKDTYIAGIYEPVFLEINEAVCVSDVYAPLDLENESINFEAVIDNHSGKTVESNIYVKIRDNKSQSVVAKKNKTLQIKKESLVCRMNFPSSNFKLWQPEEPNLYDIEVRVKTGDREDIFLQRTGFKKIEARGNDFYLNDKPYFLLGYGDDFAYPIEGIPSALDSKYYYPSLKLAKEYGFNASRHHSHFPFQAYLDAADELGLLVQPELAMANIPISQFNDKNEILFQSQWEELILENRHHPCIMGWCGGNEQEWGYPFEEKLYNLANKLDPYRLVMATDGNFMAKDIGPFHDYASIVYAEYTDVLPLDEFSNMYLRDNCGKPQIVHEMGNYCTLPPIDDLPKYENAVVYPDELASFDDYVKENKLEQLYNRSLDNSYTMQRLCHKINIETARRSPYVSGYHIWTFVDYYETTQGVVSRLLENKGFTASKFSKLNLASLLLWEREQFVFNAGEQISIDMKLSKYHSKSWTNAKITLSLSDGQQTTLNKSITGHGIMELTKWSINLPNSSKAQQLKLNAVLQCDGVELQNSWSLWVYPKTEIIQRKDIFINYLSRYLFEDCPFPINHFTVPMPLDENNLIVTGFIYNGMLEAVKNGASMLLLAQTDTFHGTVCKNSFKLPWWMPLSWFYLNRSNNIQISNILEDHTALTDIPHGDCWDLNFYRLVENRHAINIDELNLDVEPIIYGVNTKLNRLAYLFEFKLGKGKILVSTLNFDRDKISHPEARYTINNLVNYCQSDRFSPNCSLSIDRIKDALCS